MGMVSMIASWFNFRIHFFFFQAEDGIRDIGVTGVQTCALPISGSHLPQADPYRTSPARRPPRGGPQGPHRSRAAGARVSPVLGVPGVDFSVEDVRGHFPTVLEIRPLVGPIDATVKVPGSKSVTNRALLVAALAEGTSTITNPLFSDDSYYLMHALVRLGFDLHADATAGEVNLHGQRGIDRKRVV